MRTKDLKQTYWLQDPLDHDVFAQWTIFPETEWVFNYRQKELSESTPLHPFANKEWFHVSELSGTKNCLVKGKTARADNAEVVTRLGIDIDEGVTLDDIRTFEKLTGHLLTTKIRTHGPADGKANWQIFIHLKPVHKRNYGRAREVHEAFSDLWKRGRFKIDTCFIGDWARNDRYNPHDRGNRKNYKYSEHNDVVTVEQGPTYELCEVVTWLEELGYKFTQHKSFHSSFEKVEKYFRSHKKWEGRNQKELAEHLGIPYRTLQLVLKHMAAKERDKKKDVNKALLVMSWQGSTRPVNTRHLIITSNIYRFKPEFPRTQQHIEKIKTYARPPFGNKDNKKNRRRISVIEMYKGQNVPLGIRNSVTYAITRELDFLNGGNLTPGTALSYIKSNFTYDDPHTFTDNEILKTVKSALKARYLSPLSRKTLIKWELIPDNYCNLHNETSIPRISPPAIPDRQLDSNNREYPNSSRVVKIGLLTNSERINHDYRRGPPH